MEPSTVQKQQQGSQQVVIVRPQDRARWATLHDHLHKVDARIGYPHLTLLEEVHYIRDPAGGGLKNATWLLKIRGSELSFATSDGVIAFLLKKLQDPAVAAGTKAEAAVFTARHGQADTSSGRCNNSAAGGKGAQPANKPGQRMPSGLPQPPAKKQCLSSPNARVPAGAAAGAGSRGRQQHSATEGRAEPQRRASDSAHAAATSSMNRPAGTAAANSTTPMQRHLSGSHAQKRPRDSQQVSSSHVTDPVSSNERTSSIDLMAAGALLKCFPHLKKQRSLGASSYSRSSTPGVSDRQEGVDSEQCTDLPPRPSLVYDAKRPGDLDLMTALSITGSEVMSWLMNAAEDIPETGEDLVAYMMDGDDPVVQLYGMNSANMKELRDILPGEFNPIVLGYSKADQDKDLPPDQQQQQEGSTAHGCAAKAATAGASGAVQASTVVGKGLHMAVPGSADSVATPESAGSGATAAGLGSLTVCPLSVPVVVKSPPLGRSLSTVSTTPLRTGSFTDSCKQVAAAAMQPPAAASAAKPCVKQPSRLARISKPLAAHDADADGSAVKHAAADAAAACKVQPLVLSPHGGHSSGSGSPTWSAADSADRLAFAASSRPSQLQDMAFNSLAAPSAPSPSGKQVQLQRRDPRQKLHAASTAAVAARAAATQAATAVVVGMVGGATAQGTGSSKGDRGASIGGGDGSSREAASAAAAAAAAGGGVRERSAVTQDAGAPAGDTVPAAAPAGPSAAAATVMDGVAGVGGTAADARAGAAVRSALSPAEQARLQAQNAELQRRLDEMRAERDAALLLCREFHQSMLENSHVFGLLSLSLGDSQEPDGQAAAAGDAAAAAGKQQSERQM